MQILLSIDRMGCLHGNPVNRNTDRRLRKQFDRTDSDALFFIQYDFDVESFVENLPAHSRRSLNAGWDVVVLMSEEDVVSLVNR